MSRQELILEYARQLAEAMANNDLEAQGFALHELAYEAKQAARDIDEIIEEKKYLVEVSNDELETLSNEGGIAEVEEIPQFEGTLGQLGRLSIFG